MPPAALVGGPQPWAAYCHTGASATCTVPLRSSSAHLCRGSQRAPRAAGTVRAARAVAPVRAARATAPARAARATAPARAARATAPARAARATAPARAARRVNSLSGVGARNACGRPLPGPLADQTRQTNSASGGLADGAGYMPFAGRTTRSASQLPAGMGGTGRGGRASRTGQHFAGHCIRSASRGVAEWRTRLPPIRAGALGYETSSQSSHRPWREDRPISGR